jgi:nucleoid-associated protein YgaU
MSNMNKPAQNQPKTYTVKAGDDLWDVAVAVYKDGYRWSEIAKANNLTNPNVIHSGNVLNIP